MKPLRVTVLIVGLALIATGLCIGLIPDSAEFGSAAISCGSPWIRDHTAEKTAAFGAAIDDVQHGLGGVVDEYAAFGSRCDDQLAGRGVTGIVLSSLGAATLLGMGLAAAARRSRRRLVDELAAKVASEHHSSTT